MNLILTFKGRGVIDVLHTTIDKAKHLHLMEDYLPRYSAGFQCKINRYHRWEDAQLSLLGRVLLERGMQKSEIEFSENDLSLTSYNKPYLKHGQVKFNISHSGEMVVCAINQQHEIGIDIEKVYDINILDFKSQMTDKEWSDVINNPNSQIAFYNYWTQKEAVIKAHGQGLSLALKSFEIDGNQTEIQSEKFHVKELFFGKGYKSYLAFPKKLNDMEIRFSAITI